MIGRTNIRQRLRNNDVVISAMLRFPSPAAMEIMALAGVDLVIIDNEHYPFDEETMIDLVRAADVRGMACAVRVPNAEPTRIAQIMDYGVDGILVPSVDSYEEAMQLVNAVKYAPVGERGFCPITRAASYGNGMTPEEFARRSNENSFVVPQIETKEGVEDVDRILAIPQTDWVPIGPSDLTASYGCPGKYDDPRVVNAIKTVREKALAVRKIGWEMYHTPETMAQAKKDGTYFLSLGSDQQILMNGLKQLVGAVRDWQAQQEQKAD